MHITCITHSYAQIHMCMTCSYHKYTHIFVRVWLCTHLKLHAHMYNITPLNSAVCIKTLLYTKVFTAIHQIAIAKKIGNRNYINHVVQHVNDIAVHTNAIGYITQIASNTVTAILIHSCTISMYNYGHRSDQLLVLPTQDD